MVVDEGLYLTKQVAVVFMKCTYNRGQSKKGNCQICFTIGHFTMLHFPLAVTLPCHCAFMYFFKKPICQIDL